MNEIPFFNGKVLKRTLPVVEARNAGSAPPMKRLLLAQGELAQFYDGDQPMRYLAAIEMRPGCPRGNHYHLIKEEWVYVLAGRLLLALIDPSTSERASFELAVGELAVIHPGIAHVLQPLEQGLAVEFSPTRFDAKDTVRFSVG